MKDDLYMAAATILAGLLSGRGGHWGSQGYAIRRDDLIEIAIDQAVRLREKLEERETRKT